MKINHWIRFSVGFYSYLRFIILLTIAKCYAYLYIFSVQDNLGSAMQQDNVVMDLCVLLLMTCLVSMNTQYVRIHTNTHNFYCII